jgi:hypothetical protein
MEGESLPDAFCPLEDDEILSERQGLGELPFTQTANLSPDIQREGTNINFPEIA